MTTALIRKEVPIRTINNRTTCYFCDKPALDGLLEKVCSDHKWAIHKKITGITCPYTKMNGKKCGGGMTLGALSRGYICCCHHTLELSKATNEGNTFLSRQIEALSVTRPLTGYLDGIDSRSNIVIVINRLPPEVEERHRKMLKDEEVRRENKTKSSTATIEWS
jgi:hypothetical protein